MTPRAENKPSDNGDGTRTEVAANGKGKEKEISSPRSTEQNLAAVEGGSSSMMSRIASSTVGLANSILSGTPNSSVLASATSEKGSASAASASRPHHEESSARSQPDIATGSRPFRTSQVQTHVAAEEAAFSDFLDSTPVFQPAGPSESESTWHMTATTTRGNVPPNDGFAAYSSVAEQESHDGEAVVALLMDANEHLPDSLEDDVLSPEERDSLRTALFGQSPDSRRQSVDWNHVLNFIPDYLRGEEPTVESYMDTGLSDPAEAWRGWIAQWEDVLTRYHDEVWGDLGSLVKEARREVEQLGKIQPDEPPPETPALRRLRAILGHLRG